MALVTFNSWDENGNGGTNKPQIFINPAFVASVRQLNSATEICTSDGKSFKVGGKAAVVAQALQGKDVSGA